MLTAVTMAVSSEKMVERLVVVRASTLAVLLVACSVWMGRTLAVEKVEKMVCCGVEKMVERMVEKMDAWMASTLAAMMADCLVVM